MIIIFHSYSLALVFAAATAAVVVILMIRIYDRACLGRHWQIKTVCGR